MSMCFQGFMSEVMRLPAQRLHGRSVYSRRDLGSAEWKLGLCLLAWQRRGDFDSLGFSSVTEYAERALQLSGQKLATLLATARALEHLPLFSEAYRRGEICWSKIRAIQTLVTPADEHLWLQYSRMARSDEVARKVAASPKRWKRQKALQAFLDGKPLATPEAVANLLNIPLEPGTVKGDDASPTLREDQAGGEDGSETTTTSQPQPSCKGERTVNGNEEPPVASQPPLPRKGERVTTGNLETPDGAVAKSGSEETPDGLPGSEFVPKMVRVTIDMTPDQFARYDTARLLLQARLGRRVAQGEILSLMAEAVLNSAPAKARAKHMIIVHTDADGDQAWYETSRGILPVGEEDRHRAKTAASLAAKTAGKASSEVEPISECAAGQRLGRIRSGEEQRDGPLPAKPDGSGFPRTAVPFSVLRALFARSGGRCERCGHRDNLQVHHRHRVSEGGGNDLEGLEHLCTPCHSGEHQKDYRDKPHWQRARESGMARGRPGSG